MEFRLSILDDLSQLKRVYKDIVDDMNEQKLESCRANVFI